MKLWITTVIAGACLTLGATMLQAQPADGPGGPGGRIQRRGADNGAAPADRPAPGDRERDRARQRDGEQAGQGQGPEGRRPPMPPMHRLMIALDTDKDGVLSATEIAAASANLAKLDKNGDGKIDRIELHPPRPEGKKDGQGPGAGKGAKDGKGPQDGQGPRAGKGPRPGQGPRPGNRQPPTPPAASQE